MVLDYEIDISCQLDKLKYLKSLQAKNILNEHHQQALLKEPIKPKVKKTKEDDTNNLKLTNLERKQQQAENKKKRFEKAQNYESIKIEKASKRKIEMPTNKQQVKKAKIIKCKTNADLYTQKERTLTDFINDKVPLQDINEKYTRKIVLGKAKQIPYLQHFIDSYRFIYNQIVSLSNDTSKCKEIFKLENPPLQDLTTYVIESTKNHVAVKDIPLNHKQQAAQEFIKAKNACKAELMKFKLKNQSTMIIEARTIKFGLNGLQKFN